MLVKLERIKSFHFLGYTMSTFIRRYSRYLNEKSLAYRLIAIDITKTKRGTNGVMRTMNTKELLNTLPVIQTQFDALLNFNVRALEILLKNTGKWLCLTVGGRRNFFKSWWSLMTLLFNVQANPDELTNGIIHAAFLLLFKDSLRLFAAYNEGILNLLGKYFDMRKNQCRESLDIYIKFLGRTTKLAQFLKVAEVQKSTYFQGFSAVFCIRLVSYITIPLTPPTQHW
uniref:ENTH domain-containing protein n=1 Tax=Sus scrofa TaxID=9823 RepID=A0A8D1KQY1_PIG